jgi:dTDP-4-amino-4,6-dideoxygalactose transaminase
MDVSRSYSIPRFALPYTAADFIAGLRAALGGGPPAEAFGLFDQRPKFWTRSGRQALRLLLQALDLRPGSGVAVPLFTDPSLFAAIAAAGHRPVFIDVDPRFLTIDPKCLERASGKVGAVVAVHLFGQVAEMPAVLEAARGVPLIEDSAHAPLSYWNGRMAGTFGVATFYSFASTKYWPAGGGGLAVVNDVSLARSLANLVRSLSPPSRFEELRNVVLLAAKAAVFQRRMYGFCGRPLRRWAEDWALLEPSLDLRAIQRSWAAVACRQATRLEERVALQRANSLQLLARLGAVEDLSVPYERPGARYNYHLFPVLLRNGEERAAMMAALWMKFVDTSKIYSGVIKEAKRFGYQGGCPVAESVADRLITLPNYAGLSGRDIDAVAEALLSSLKACRQSGSLPAWCSGLAGTAVRS